ncbi:hypothetical protein F4861DRAFT_18887 [Xylaria intraflava]|nr:hypothetical protein F4861DRAFT_18887 [Xylaria intraflava]
MELKGASRELTNGPGSDITATSTLSEAPGADNGNVSRYQPYENTRPRFRSKRPYYRRAKRTLYNFREFMSRAPAFPRTTTKPKGPNFNDLPPEIVRMIWRWVAETPSLVHLRLYHGAVHLVTPYINEEHLVNKTWYFAPEFRASLCRHSSHDKLRRFAGEVLEKCAGSSDPELGYFVQQVADAAHGIKEWHPRSGGNPFMVEVEGGERSLSVRPAVDWFYLENYLDRFARIFTYKQSRFLRHLSRVATVVLRLEDTYKSMCEVLNPYNVTPKEPWRVDRHDVGEYVRKMATIFGTIVEESPPLEECLILVGDLPIGIQPSEMQAISVEWTEPRPEPYSVETRREIVTYPEVSPADRAMIRFVYEELEHFRDVQRERRNNWLRSSAGQASLSHFVHDRESWHSYWLACPEGSLWRETAEGQAWLRTPSGHWWLASLYGSPWLETRKGLEWLDSEEGVRFLELPAARVWAGTGGNNKNDSERRRLPNKKWFNTPKGRLWIAHNCPDYLVPITPQPPVSEDGEHTDRTHPIPDWFFIRAPKIGFIMSPLHMESEISVQM